MAERKTDPPAPETGKSKRGTGSGRGASRLEPDQYEIKIRWEKARQVLGVSPTGVKFDFNTALQVGSKYPISVTAPGVSLSSTVEVTRCQLTVEPSGGRFFRIEGLFFPYLE